MASSFCNPHTLSINSSTKRAVSRISMVQSTQVTTTRICTMKFRLIAENKIYEDHERGIVCYRGGDGKVVCEGLDEGPRYQPPAPRKFIDPKFGNVSCCGLHEDPRYQLLAETGLTDQRELQILALLDGRFN